MREQDLENFARIMATLGEVFEPGVDLSSLRIEVYFQALKGFEIDQISAAASTIISTRTYAKLPLPGEIINAIEGDANDQALVAWLKVKKILLGPPGATVEDPIAARVVRALGGWGVLSMVPESKLAFYQKEFEREYKLLKKKSVGEPKMLPGSAVKQLVEKTMRGMSNE